MRLTFLGTGAAEGYPSLFCHCDFCQRARALGGRSLRKRCSALVDDDLLIDLGPDLVAASQQHGVNLAGIRYLLQTHAHTDHLDPNNLTFRMPASTESLLPWLTWYAPQTTLDHAMRVLRASHYALAAGVPDDYLTRARLHVQAVTPEQTFPVGPYEVTSLQAAHGSEDETALLYLISEGGRTLFYATDSGPLPAEAWETLRTYGRRLTLVVMDATFGVGRGGTTHHNRQTLLTEVSLLRQAHLLAPDCRILVTHISHHANPPHDELTALLAPHGIEVAYDGQVVDV